MLLYGPSGSGKTFLALYFASCLARGVDAFERRVQKGATLYVALEGQHGFGARMRAACASYGDLEDAVARLKTPISLGTDPQSAAYVNRLIGAVGRLRKRSRRAVGLVVIDTFACAMPADNENDAAAISAVMSRSHASGLKREPQYCCSIIRERTATGVYAALPRCTRQPMP